MLLPFHVCPPHLIWGCVTILLHSSPLSFSPLLLPSCIFTAPLDKGLNLWHKVKDIRGAANWQSRSAIFLPDDYFQSKLLLRNWKPGEMTDLRDANSQSHHWDNVESKPFIKSDNQALPTIFSLSNFSHENRSSRSGVETLISPLSSAKSPAMQLNNKMYFVKYFSPCFTFWHSSQSSSRNEFWPIKNTARTLKN